MPNTVIYANMLPAIGILFVMFFTMMNPLFDKKQNKMFLFSYATVLFMLVVISIDYTVSLGTYEYTWVIRRITTFLHFAFSCAVPIFLICIFTNKRLTPILWLPAGANLVICFISMFAKIVFYFPKDGSYERGPLFAIPSLVTIFYIVYLLILSIKSRNQRSYEAIFLVGTILGLVFSLYLEVIKYFKFLSWDFAAVFLILYYLLLNINKSKLDPLTGANNRAMYLQKTDSINFSRRCIIAMIDINGFKAINDEHGHEAGDKLLIQFVATAKAHMDKKNILYRIGGDEFAIISEDCSIDQFKHIVEPFFTQLKEYNVHCAVGIAEYAPDGDIENAIHLADMKMYENKRQYHSDEALIQ